MMSEQMTNAMLRGLQAAGTRAARAATVAAVTMLVARMAQAAPEILVEADDDTVRLRARGLWARVFGSRCKTPDSQLADIIEGGR